MGRGEDGQIYITVANHTISPYVTKRSGFTASVLDSLFMSGKQGLIPALRYRAVVIPFSQNQKKKWLPNIAMEEEKRKGQVQLVYA